MGTRTLATPVRRQSVEWQKRSASTAFCRLGGDPDGDALGAPMVERANSSRRIPNTSTLALRFQGGWTLVKLHSTLGRSRGFCRFDYKIEFCFCRVSVRVNQIEDGASTETAAKDLSGSRRSKLVSITHHGFCSYRD